jgi:hypothetical protein
VLPDAREELLGVERVAVDLDQTEARCDLSQEPKALAFGLAPRIGLEPEVGMLRLWRDLIVNGDDTLTPEGRLCELFG